MNICKAKFIFFIPAMTLVFLGWGDMRLFAREGYNEPPRRSSCDNNGRLRINRDYFQLSADTGGDFYFWAPGEFAASAPILQIPVTSDPVLLDYGNGDRFEKSYKIPVDSGVALLSVFAGTQRKEKFDLHRPDGRSVSKNPAFVSKQNYRHMNIITVENPEPGIWLLEFSGTGSYAVTVRCSTGNRKNNSGRNEGIGLIGMEFVEPGGRPGHEGLFPVKGKVRAGESRLCKIKVTGTISKPVAEFISRDNKVLGRVKLRPHTPESDGELIGTCTIPSIPFRTKVSGHDVNGYTFQRVTSAVYTPETSGIKVSNP